MKGLYNKVVKGQYSRIPSHYSQHLANVVDMCLQVKPSKRPSAGQLLRTKELVLHLKDTGVEEHKLNSAVSLLDTIKLPTNLKLIKDRLPSAKYDSTKEEIKIDKSATKMRNYSARNRSIDAARLGSKLSSRDQSLSALKEYQKTPASSRNYVRVNKVDKKDYASLLPPRSNRPANYRKNSDRVACPLPPIVRPAGLPSLGPSQYRLRSESRDSNVLPIGSSSPVGDGLDRGYKRRADHASRQKLQRHLINKAFGLPVTPIAANKALYH